MLKKKIKKIIPFIIIGIIVFLLLILFKKYFYPINIIKNIEIPDLPRPFVNLYDDKNNKINVILVSHTFTREKGTDGTYEQYNYWKKKGIHFIGVTSYSEFPSILSNPYDPLSDPKDPSWNHDYMKYFRLWLNCFRNPNKYIKDKTTKKALISESDFISDEFKPDNNISKKYDFLYICLKDDESKCDEGWNYYIRNWKLAKKLIKIMCTQFNLKGIIIGRKNCNLPEGCEKNITFKDKVPQKELIQIYNQTKILLLPNIVDASPRTLAEALSCNVRCLVNYNILGGWKYVNNQTGEFFKNENDFVHSLQKILKNYESYKPREYFWKNYGKLNSGVKLRDFLLNNLSNLNFSNQTTKYINMHV